MANDPDTPNLGLSKPQKVADVALPTPPGAGEERYDGPEEIIGRGGMGVVSLTRDRRIGRKVAKKTLHPALAHAREARIRFIREAQVQGQLEHPAVVPVYDLVADDGAPPSFTMKAIRGVTIEEILGHLRSTPDTETAYSRHRLLSAFATVCLAVHYAHERGVLHRDLKPANVMLGDYGEVYVLDWGIARIESIDDVAGERIDVEQADEAMTAIGTVLGTAGYVAPEQLIIGSSPDRRSDVYALGAILFELLTLEKLHAGKNTQELAEATLRGADARPSARAPDRDIAPELDTICQRATALDPDDRYADARALYDAVEAVLKGERDLELRREKAREHAARAAGAAETLSTAGDHLEARRTAMRELGRALALDPSNTEAIRIMAALLDSAPDEMPPEVEREIDRSYRQRIRWMSRISAGTYLAVLGFVPLVWWMGLRQPGVVGVGFALLAAAAALSLKAGTLRRAATGWVIASLITSVVAFGFLGRFLGPLILVPAALAVNATGYAVFLERKWRPLIVLSSLAVILVPLGLEWAGVLPASYGFDGEGFTALPGAIDLQPTGAMLLLTGASIASIVIGTVIVGHIRDRLAEAEQRINIYAWHLGELVPPSARSQARLAGS